MKKTINKLLGVIGLKLTKKQAIKKNDIIKTQGDIFNGDVKPPFDEVPFAGETIQYLIKNYKFNNVLDIGSGEGKHSDLFRKFDKEVTSIDYGKSVYFEKREKNHTCVYGDYYTYNFENKFDVIWASHVLEHQANPNLFLKKLHNDLIEGGILAITVPPLKHEIVGGHVTLWNAGLLMYHLVLAGFNCSDISIKSYGYNISIILKKESITEFPILSYDKGDLIKLKEFFPDFVKEPFSGNIDSYNWLIN